MEKKSKKLFSRFVTRLLTLLGFGTSAFAFMACYGVPTDNYRLAISPPSVSLPAEESEAEVELESNGGWKITTEDPFVTVTPMSGFGDTTLTISVQANTSELARSATIKIGNGDVEYEMTVEQKGAQKP